MPVFPADNFKIVRMVLLVVLAAVMATTASRAAPLVSFEVRAVSVGLTGSSSLSPAASILSGGHCVTMYTGDSVVLQLIATLHAQNGDLTDDGFTGTDGSFITVGTNGNPIGFLRTDGLTTPGVDNVDPFRGIGADSGVAIELSGTRPGGANDGILDIGASSTSSFIGYFTSRANGLAGVVGQSFILGETILTINGGSGSTTVGYFPRIGVAGSIANRANVVFKIDKVAYSLNGDGSGTGGAADAFTFQSVEINHFYCVPEPTVFGMLLSAAASLAGFRRLGFRNSGIRRNWSKEPSGQVVP